MAKEVYGRGTNKGRYTFSTLNKKFYGIKRECKALFSCVRVCMCVCVCVCVLCVDISLDDLTWLTCALYSITECMHTFISFEDRWQEKCTWDWKRERRNALLTFNGNEV